MGKDTTEMRLVQIFLSQSGPSGPSVNEVLADESNKLFCTCPGFKSRTQCKHVSFVKARIENNNGTYPLEISDRATEVDAEKAKLSLQGLREFIVKYGKIEVF